jgi:mycofactocin precursor
VPNITIRPEGVTVSEEIMLQEADAEADSVVEEDAATDEALLESLLVEEVSIDGMCGVY